MKRSIQIAALCCLVPCCGCWLGTGLLNGLLGGDADVKIAPGALDRMGVAPGSREATRIQMETNNVDRASRN